MVLYSRVSNNTTLLNSTGIRSATTVVTWFCSYCAVSISFLIVGMVEIPVLLLMISSCYWVTIDGLPKYSLITVLPG